MGVLDAGALGLGLYFGLGLKLWIIEAWGFNSVKPKIEPRVTPAEADINPTPPKGTHQEKV